MVTFATPGSEESESFTFLVHENAQCMSGTFNETSVSSAAASVLAVDSDGASGIEISTSDEASLVVPEVCAGDWLHPIASNTDKPARNRSFMAAYPFSGSETKHNDIELIGRRVMVGKQFSTSDAADSRLFLIT